MNSDSRSTADDLEQLAVMISQVAKDHQKQQAKRHAELAWQGKQHPTKPQAPPCGLFEQRQEPLWKGENVMQETPLPFSDDDLKGYILRQPPTAPCGDWPHGICLLDQFVHETYGMSSLCGFCTLRIGDDKYGHTLSPFAQRCVAHFVAHMDEPRTFGQMQQYLKGEQGGAL